jgi:hypothetical protein
VDTIQNDDNPPHLKQVSRIKHGILAGFWSGTTPR